MSKMKNIYTMRTGYKDRAKFEKELFAELTVKIREYDTAVLLLSSSEDLVLISVLKQITEYVRKRDENIAEVREKELHYLLLDKEFFMHNNNVIVKRFALYLVTLIIENMNVLLDLDPMKAIKILDLCVKFYLAEGDNYCVEYLSVIINKSFDDPKSAKKYSTHNEYLDRLYGIIATTTNPDTLLHALEALYKILNALSIKEMDTFLDNSLFPIDRIICDVTNEYYEIRTAVLKVLKILVGVINEKSPIQRPLRPENMLQQLTNLFCNHTMSNNMNDAIDVLSIAFRTEQFAQIFFEKNLFDKIIQYMDYEVNLQTLPMRCNVAPIFAELASYEQYLYRLHVANITDLLLECILHKDMKPLPSVLLGLNRIMKFNASGKRILEAYEFSLIAKLLSLILNKEYIIKGREQAAELVHNLLIFAYHDTAAELIKLDFPNILSVIFEFGMHALSIDFILSLLSIVEHLAQNIEYREVLTQSHVMIRNLGLLLKDSFSAAIVVTNIFRCLSTLIDNEEVRATLLSTHILASIRRALKSISNIVRTAVTNFIMQTTRFPEYCTNYIDTGVLETLIMLQKHAYCVSTWNPAIDSILSKCPTMKFCIRNHLSFTDTTVGNDFLVSKMQFEDFRIFQRILNEEVSPLHPILLITFQRTKNPSNLVITVPDVNSTMIGEEIWTYCRRPGDDILPTYLEELNEELEKKGLLETLSKGKRCIDFENISRRAKIIAQIVAKALNTNLKGLDLNSTEECSQHIVKCHLRDLKYTFHCNFLPIGYIKSGCQFERAILFKALSDQIGLPSTLQRSVDGRILFNEVPLPVKVETDIHCDYKTMNIMPWRLLRPTHIVDLMYNIGELYPIQSRQAIQYLRLY